MDSTRQEFIDPGGQQALSSDLTAMIISPFSDHLNFSEKSEKSAFIPLPFAIDSA